jgi:hypothetical protein
MESGATADAVRGYSVPARVTAAASVTAPPRIAERPARTPPLLSVGHGDADITDTYACGPTYRA